MKYVTTTHYVEKSFEGKPSFIIVLEDKEGLQKEFISNGCVFKELTPKNEQDLINRFNCKEFIEELKNSPIKNEYCIKDARYMFWNAEVLESVSLSLPSAIYCNGLLEGCTSLESVNLYLPAATDCSYLLEGCTFPEDKINFEYL